MKNQTFLFVATIAFFESCSSASNSGDSESIPLWALIASGIFLIFVIAGLFLGKEEGKSKSSVGGRDYQYPKTPQRRKEYFGRDEAVALINVGAGFLKIQKQDNPLSNPVFNKEWNRMAPCKNSPFLSYLERQVARGPSTEDSMKILQDMHKGKRRYAAGFLASILVSDLQVTDFEKRLAHELLTSLDLENDTFAYLTDYWENSDIEVLDY